MNALNAKTKLISGSRESSFIDLLELKEKYEENTNREKKGEMSQKMLKPLQKLKYNLTKYENWVVNLSFKFPKHSKPKRLTH